MHIDVATQALDAMLVEMTGKAAADRATRVLFIFAGYKKEMQSFLEYNPGWSRRMTHFFELEVLVDVDRMLIG